MSDRYVFAENSCPEDDFPPFEQSVDISEAERKQAYEELPLQLTDTQRLRLWIVLRDEIGPAAALRALKRIEAEA